MLPPKTDAIWGKLVKGDISHEFKSFPASMMLSRHKRLISRDNSQQTILKLIDEAYEFFTKYENILQDDIEAIFK